MELNLDRVFKTNCETLYKIWTDADKMSKWFDVEVTTDVSIGGQLKFDFPGEPAATTGEYKKLNPFSNLSFTWNSFCDGKSTGETLVTVSIEKVDEQSSKMSICHSGFTNESAVNDHYGGWTEYYDMWEKSIA